MIMNREDGKKFERAVLDKLGVDRRHVVPGSVAVEGGRGEASVTWDCAVTMPEQLFIDFYNGLSLRAEDQS